MLIEIPGVALLGWHHAVWQSPQDALSDISPHPITGMAIGATTFALDSNQHYSLDWPPIMPQIFEPLARSETLAAFTADEAEVHALRARYRDSQRVIASATCFPGPDEIVVRVETTKDLEDLKRVERRFLPLIRAARRGATRSSLP